MSNKTTEFGDVSLKYLREARNPLSNLRNRRTDNSFSDRFSALEVLTENEFNAASADDGIRLGLEATHTLLEQGKFDEIPSLYQNEGFSDRQAVLADKAQVRMVMDYLDHKERTSPSNFLYAQVQGKLLHIIGATNVPKVFWGYSNQIETEIIQAKEAYGKHNNFSIRSGESHDKTAQSYFGMAREHLDELSDIVLGMPDLPNYNMPNDEPDPRREELYVNQLNKLAHLYEKWADKAQDCTQIIDPEEITEARKKAVDTWSLAGNWEKLSEEYKKEVESPEFGAYISETGEPQEVRSELAEYIKDAFGEVMRDYYEAGDQVSIRHLHSMEQIPSELKETIEPYFLDSSKAVRTVQNLLFWTSPRLYNKLTEKIHPPGRRD